MGEVSLGQRIKNYLGNAWDEIGVSLHASARQGAKELAQILPAFPESVHPVEELGTIGNPTQLQVNREQGEAAPRMEREALPEREM